MKTPKIAIIHPEKAFLPEVLVYQTYFSKHGFEANVFYHVSAQSLQDYDIEWHFMGMDHLPKAPGRLKIHEYASLSVPPFAKGKNFLKKKLNVQPDLRIFLNSSIREAFGFTDHVPSLIRAPGIGEHFFQSRPAEKYYDFVYIGATDKNRRIDILIHFFMKRFGNQKLLIVGAPAERLQKQLMDAENIHFTSKVAYTEVSAYARQAKYGLNYLPAIYPFFLQPSYKLLEYCALDLKIVTTDYDWVNQFEQVRGGRFFKIKSDWSNFYPEMIADFDFKTPDVSDLQWDQVLDQFGILPFIQQWLAIS